MIVVDTSAIVAIVFGEPEREAFVRVAGGAMYELPISGKFGN
jgi:uncharacterized protein with PIN domain